MPRVPKKVEDDSDDRLGDLNSSQWGKGTSQVVAQHYSTVQQNRKRNKFDNSGKGGSLKGAGDGGDLTAEEFSRLIAELEAERAVKKQNKKAGAKLGQEKGDLSGRIRATKEDVGDLDEEIKEV